LNIPSSLAPGAPGLSCIPYPSLELAISPGTLVPFIGEWYLEAKVWV
jgi:hypothetical protein